jgi:hypothetical protein
MKMVILLKAIYIFDTMSLNIPMSFLTEVEKTILIHMEE